jgi:predicted small lipoprotein YifL
MSLLRMSAVGVLVVSFAAAAIAPIAACGKKGPLYLPEPETSATPADSVPASRDPRERR